jgi:hypothetical protein
MPSSGAPDPGVGIWVGKLDSSVLESAPAESSLPLLQAEGYQRARLLIVTDGMPRGFVVVSVRDGAIAPTEVRALAGMLPAPHSRQDEPPPPVSVVICTRDRPDQLRVALASLLSMDYPAFEIIVVDQYVTRVLPGAVLRGVADALRGRLSGLARSVAVVAGLIVTAAGYLSVLRSGRQGTLGGVPELASAAGGGGAA